MYTLIWFIIIELFLINHKLLLQNLSSISDFFAAFAAIFNLIFIIAVYRKSNSQKQQEEELSKTSYWYRNLIIDRNINDITEIFDKLIDDVRELKSTDVEEKYYVSIKDFQDKKRSLIHILNDMIRVLDPHFADNLDETLDDLEDEFTIRCEDLFTCQSEIWSEKHGELVTCIQNLKSGYFQKLYLYELKGYKYTY